MKRKFSSNPRIVTGLLLPASVLMAVAVVGEGRVVSGNPPPAPLGPDSALVVRYTLNTPGAGEIFPALAASGSAQYWPVATLTMENITAQALRTIVSAEIPDWSRQCVQSVNLAPKETRTIRLNPQLLPQAFLIGEIRPATLEVNANILGANLGYNETRPVYLHSASDFFWGDKLANAQFIARWVTPHDPAVMELVSSARKYVRRGRLAGYELPGGSAAVVAAQVQDESRSIFTAMEHLGLSYVDSIYTYGHFAAETERVRLPHETLSLKSANCIDMSVAFASALENLGLDPVIVLVPGHAFTGVRLAPGSSNILYLDLTVMPDGSFDAAVRRAQNWLQKTPKAKVNIIDISTARAHQIYPMSETVLPVSAQKEQG